MLRNVPRCISPDLIHALMSMGHGDEIVLADADFPAVTNSGRVIRADGVDIARLLEAILPFFPLDAFVEKPAVTMDCSEWGDEPESYERFRRTIRKHNRKFKDFDFLGRFEFYERARGAFAVVVTSEADGNVILKKGPVMMDPGDADKNVGSQKAEGDANTPDSLLVEQSSANAGGARYIDKYKVLLLDMGRTFMFNVDRFYDADAVWAMYCNLGGDRLNSQDLYQILSQVFHQIIADSKKPEKQESFPPVLAYLSIHPKSAQLPLHEIGILERVFCEQEIGSVPQRYVNVLRELHTTHRLGVVSDIWSRSDRFYRELEHVGIRGLFETIVFSSDIRVIKPSRKIFQKALDAFGSDPSDVVCIGDSLQRDIAGAKKAGMATVWIQNGEVSETNPSVQPDIVINDLQDILTARAPRP